MTFFRLFLSITYFLQATIYEDAEDKKTSRWKLINTDYSSTVHNVNDSNKKSRIIEFKGAGTKHSYELKTKKTKKMNIGSHGK